MAKLLAGADSTEGTADAESVAKALEELSVKTEERDKE